MPNQANTHLPTSCAKTGQNGLSRDQPALLATKNWFTGYWAFTGLVVQLIRKPIHNAVRPPMGLPSHQYFGNFLAISYKQIIRPLCR